MLNGKLYLIHSPSLIQAAMRNKDISFDPLFLQFGKTIGGLNAHQMDHIYKPEILKQFSTIIHSSLTASALSNMIAVGLVEVKTALNAIPAGSGLHIPHVYPWLKEVASMSAVRGLFGEKNMIDKKALQDIWYATTCRHTCALVFALD